MRPAINNLAAKMLGMAAAFMAVLPAMSHAQQSPVGQTTITNIATANWDVGPSRAGQTSNRVDITVNTTPPTTLARLTTFEFVGSQGGGQPMPVPQTLCVGPNGPSPINIGGAFSGLSMNPAQLREAHQIRAGEPLVVAIDSAADNRAATTAETLTVVIETTAGDRETVTLQETAPNSARFAGVLRTRATPPAATPGDCVLSVNPGGQISLTGTRIGETSPLASAPVDILVDPFGIAFDSGDGTPVPGTRITLVDAATGQPAEVFGDDAVSRFPSTLVTGPDGTTVTDAGGNQYVFPAGFYRFPFARPGTYRLIIEPPAPYTAPSASSPAELANLQRPDGVPFTIQPGSYGQTFVLSDPAPVRIDIPLDRPGAAIGIRKAASQPVVVAGDALQYRIELSNGDPLRSTGAITVTDILPEEIRLRINTVRYNGIRIPYLVSSDGRTLTINLPALAAGGRGTITYLAEVRPDARAGISMNRASARDNRGSSSAVVDAAVRIARDGITERMTIIGRITDGGCTVDPNAANGVANVRVMLEDGSYAVTDEEGRYHFEGVLPGLHVVQIDPATLPSNQVPADCVRNARSAGSAISRFVEGQGGGLYRADFYTQTGQNAARPDAEAAKRMAPATDQEAAGTNTNWLADETPEIKWLYPAPEHNPRTKAVRVAIKHLAGQTVKLLLKGQEVSPLSFQGLQKNGAGTVAVSVWRGIAIEDGTTLLTAEVRDADGVLVQKLDRGVYYSGSPIRAQYVREKSLLVADGVTRPVIAVRLTDRNGRPAHHGTVGDFAVNAPYYAAVEADAQAARGLAGLERGRPVWKVEGEEGMAYIELEPTTASGTLNITLPFRDGEVTRKQLIEAWLTPGKRPWTIVGFAAGTAGFNTLKGRLERLGENGDHWYTDARVALYAKGRVKGQWLMTMSYDSDKAKDETRFQGVIDPTAYYTIYADRSERRYDAASVRNLYLKLERPQFYALFGDYETGINEPQLTRYSRAFNGVKAEFRNDRVSATAFAADTPYRNRREEIQGNGLSGPYALAARDILPNSERVLIEVRDRLRSDRIVESRALIRNIDYDIDYVAGTLRFREPILSRSIDLDPQFIVVTYEVDGVAQRVTNAGGRVTISNASKTLTIGATAIHNEDDIANTNVGGVDVKFQPTENTEIRAEFAASDAKGKAGSTGVTEGTSTAWMVEAEHHGGKFDVLAYARQQEAGYGVGQTNVGEAGSRKIGVDGRVKLSKHLSVLGSAWNEDYLNSPAERQAGRVLAEYRTPGLGLRAGLTYARDKLTNGNVGESTILQLGATKRFLKDKLELDAQTELPLGQSESIDFPARHRLSARYAVSDDVAMVGAYEIANGDSIKARTARIGFDVKPWAGGKLIASANRQSFDENGPRTYAAYGLSQSLPVGKKVTVDLTLDGNKTLGGVDPSKVLNTAQPVASGGFIGTDNLLSEDFTAVTAGATYRGKDWSITGRAEYRAGDLSDRYGINIAALRQIGEGKAFGGQISWFRAKQGNGPSTEAANIAASLAWRPDTSRWSFLNKLEFRSDKVTGAVAGLPGPIGGAPLTLTGAATSKRVINSLAINWSPSDERNAEYLTRSELSFFWGTRYTFDRIEADQLKGWSNVVGADVRFDLGKMFDVGASVTARQNPGRSAISYSGGPTLSIAPAKNAYITIGYNVVGFKDRDFEAARYTRKGPFVTMRMKFDQDSLGGLLGRNKGSTSVVEPMRLPANPVNSEEESTAAMTPIPTEQTEKPEKAEVAVAMDIDPAVLSRAMAAAGGEPVAKPAIAVRKPARNVARPGHLARAKPNSKIVRMKSSK